MIVSTFLDSGRFGGNYQEDKIPSNRTICDIFYSGNFLIPIWNGTEWIDGATPEEISEQKADEQLNELVSICEYLTDRSLISSVNKEGGEKYLQGQITRYKEKYKVAKQYVADQTINNQFWYDAIVVEMNNTATILGVYLDIPMFMGIIVEQFELGELRSQRFETAIEIFRCKTKDLILANEFERAGICLTMAKNIPLQMSIEDLDNFLIQLNEI